MEINVTYQRDLLYKQQSSNNQKKHEEQHEEKSAGKQEFESVFQKENIKDIKDLYTDNDLQALKIVNYDILHKQFKATSEFIKSSQTKNVIFGEIARQTLKANEKEEYNELLDFRIDEKNQNIFVAA